jgi:hypothetical protein
VRSTGDCGRKAIGCNDRAEELELSYSIERLDDETDSNLKGLRRRRRYHQLLDCCSSKVIMRSDP